MLPNFAYIRARSKQEALDNLASQGAYVHAGGTDLLGCARDEVFEVEKLVSISRLEELKGITHSDEGGIRIGALTTISEIAASAVIRESYPGLAQAASDVASPQLRNQGTLGGNLCQRPRCWYFRGDFHCAKRGGDMCYAVEGENRYHAIFGGDPCYIVHPSDTAPMLVALGAEVRISGARGERSMALEDFFVLPDQDLERRWLSSSRRSWSSWAPSRGPLSLLQSHRRTGWRRPQGPASQPPPTQRSGPRVPHQDPTPDAPPRAASQGEGRPKRVRAAAFATVLVVGLRGFEPPTFGPPDRRANQAAPQPVSGSL